MESVTTVVVEDTSKEALNSSRVFVSTATSQSTRPASAPSPGVRHRRLQIIMHTQAAMDSNTMLSPPSTNSRHMLMQGTPGMLFLHKHSTVQRAT